MPNRAERRSKNRNGVPDQYDQTRGRGRSGMIDEYALQEKSRRLPAHVLSLPDAPYPVSLYLTKNHLHDKGKRPSPHL